MTKQILAIISSRGEEHTYHLVRVLEAKMQEFGESEVEYCILEEVALHLCRRCYACITRGEEHCPFRDERSSIEERMLDADGVIFAAPNAVSNMRLLVDSGAYELNNMGDLAMLTVAIARLTASRP